MPKENAKEAAIVNDIEVLGLENLIDVIEFLSNQKIVEPERINVEELFKSNIKNEVDFSEVKGQDMVKRALEIAAAGGHNCLLIR